VSLRASFVTICLCFVSSFVTADQITLKNGDHLTGTITSADGTNLNLKTDYAGDLVIKWDAVQSFSSDQPLYITPKTGELVMGKVTTMGSKLEVATANGSTVELQKDAIKTVARNRNSTHMAPGEDFSIPD